MSHSPAAAPPHTHCSICAGLQDQEYAAQKYGWEEDHTQLPAAARRLNVVRDLRPYGSRALQLQQCPECGTYYLYRTDYEYLVNGSEDEEYLTRLTPEQAAQIVTSFAPGGTQP